MSERSSSSLHLSGTDVVFSEELLLRALANVTRPPALPIPKVIEVQHG